MRWFRRRRNHLRPAPVVEVVEMTGAEHEVYPRLIKELADTLKRAAEERHSRMGFTESGELEWVIYERGVMHDATNRLRSRRGLPPVDETPILRAENMAVGHFDYAAKFAMYCAGIAVGDRDQ